MAGSRGWCSERSNTDNIPKQSPRPHRRQTLPPLDPRPTPTLAHHRHRRGPSRQESNPLTDTPQPADDRRRANHRIAGAQPEVSRMRRARQPATSLVLRRV
jgi:hypothetical protein